MVNKPRRRKKTGHGRIYLVLGIILVLAASSVSYAYVAGLGPFNKGPTSTTTTATESVIYAIINTTKGSFEVELFNSSTPKTVANFVSLAESGFYNNLTWWRVEPGFVIQTGDPNTRNGGGNRSQWGEGTSGISIPFEYDPSLHNYEGYLGMASTAPGAGGSSQFYINLANNTSLDGKYAVFGKVISGMNVVQAIGAVPVEAVGGVHEPITPVYVIDIKILNNP